MKLKRRIATVELYKNVATLNIDDSQHVKGVNFWQTFAPVATWGTIRLILIMALMRRWQTRQIDYILACTPNAECTNMYMRIPKGFKVEVPVDGSVDGSITNASKSILSSSACMQWNQANTC